MIKADYDGSFSQFELFDLLCDDSYQLIDTALPISLHLHVDHAGSFATEFKDSMERRYPFLRELLTREPEIRTIKPTADIDARQLFGSHSRDGAGR